MFESLFLRTLQLRVMTLVYNQNLRARSYFFFHLHLRKCKVAKSLRSHSESLHLTPSYSHLQHHCMCVRECAAGVDFRKLQSRRTSIEISFTLTLCISHHRTLIPNITAWCVRGCACVCCRRGLLVVLSSTGHQVTSGTRRSP
jgi:hypothetical protein